MMRQNKGLFDPFVQINTIVILGDRLNKHHFITIPFFRLIYKSQLVSLLSSEMYLCYTSKLSRQNAL